MFRVQIKLFIPVRFRPRHLHLLDNMPRPVNSKPGNHEDFRSG